MGKDATVDDSGRAGSPLSRPRQWLARVDTDKLSSRLLDGYVTVVGVAVLVFAGAALYQGAHSADAVSHYYRAYFAAHPTQVPSQLLPVAALNSQTWSTIALAVLSAAVAVATAIYAWVANRTRREAAKAADHQRRLAASDATQIAAALDRLTAAVTIKAAAPGGQLAVRPLLVVNLGRPDRRP